MSTAEQQHDSTVKESAHESAHDVALTPFTIFRYVASIGLLIFSIIIVGALMFTGNTRVAKETNPWVALIVCVSTELKILHTVCKFVHIICVLTFIFLYLCSTTM